MPLLVLIVLPRNYAFAEYRTDLSLSPVSGINYPVSAYFQTLQIVSVFCLHLLTLLLAFVSFAVGFHVVIFVLVIVTITVVAFIIAIDVLVIIHV